MNSTRANADRIESLATELGCGVDRHRAATGSEYLTISRGAVELKIRVADHADAHATADYTADGCEGTMAGARAFLLAKLGTTEAAVRRLRRARRSAEARRNNTARQNWIKGYAEQRGVSMEEAARVCPM